MGLYCNFQSFQQGILYFCWSVRRESIIPPRLVCHHHRWQVLVGFVRESNGLSRNAVKDMSLRVATCSLSAFLHPLDVVPRFFHVVRIGASGVAAILSFAFAEVFT